MALSAVPASAAAAEARDCTRGGGVLSGVTDGLCDVVGAVTGTVDNLTGHSLKPVTDGVDGATDGVLGTVGQVAPTGKPSPSATATKGGLVPDTLGDVCLPVLACGDQSVVNTLTPKPEPTQSHRPSPAGTPTPTPSPRRTGRQEVDVLPTIAPTPPQSEPYLMDTTEQPVKDEPTADPDEPRIDLLWPNPFAQELTAPLREGRVIRPSGPASDVLGTALTIALLASAIAATRIVQQRRQRGAEPPESIPFERPHATTGRHRLA